MIALRGLFAPAAARAALVVAAVAGAVASGAAVAADFQSVGNEPAVLYDAPTLRGSKIGVAPRGMPVEVVVAQNDWVRVRDAGGAFAWVEKARLVPKRTAVATDPAPVDVRAQPDDAAPVVFRLSPGVVVDVTAAAANGWVAVRHRDGAAGYVRTGSVWGE